MAEPPPGFRRLSAGPVELVVAQELLGAVGPLGLLQEGAIDSLFERYPGAAAGRGRTARVPVGAAGEHLIVRRLLHGGALGGLLRDYFVGLRRPLREVNVTQTLHCVGTPVPRPGFALAQHVLGPIWKAAVATFEVPDSRDALAFLESLPPERLLLAACAALGRSVRSFHDAGGRHGDLHVKNLLLCGEAAPEGPQGIVIDLDKARITPGLNPEERMVQLMRLYRSLHKRDLIARVGARGCARFFSAYCADDRDLRRALWARVPRELRRVALHAVRY